MYLCLIGTAQRNFNKNNVGKGRLTERLLAQGLLTPNMLDVLQKEWDKVRANYFDLWYNSKYGCASIM